MFPWLDNNDFKKWVGEVAENFDLYAELSKFVVQNVDGWLKRCIGSTKIVELRAIMTLIRAKEANPLLPVVVIAERDQRYLDSLIPFLCFAAWSDYVAIGQVKITRSGPVKKSATNEVSGLTIEERQSLQRFYLAKAKQEALELSKLFEEDKSMNVCYPATKAGNRRRASVVISARDNTIFGAK